MQATQTDSCYRIQAYQRMVFCSIAALSNMLADLKHIHVRDGASPVTLTHHALAYHVLSTILILQCHNKERPHGMGNLLPAIFRKKPLTEGIILLLTVNLTRKLTVTRRL